MNSYHEVQHAPRSLKRFLGAIFIFETSIVAIAMLSVALSEQTNMGEILVMLAVVILVPVLMLLLLYRTTLEVTIDDVGIAFIMRPLQRRIRTIPWSDVASITVHPVHPFGEFGGWGIRGFGKKIGYMWDGKTGIDVLTTTGKRVVISITDADLARVAVERCAPASK